MKSAATGQRFRHSYCATSPDSQPATGLNKHHERRPSRLMGGASANDAPAITLIITENSNPLSDRTQPSLHTFTGPSNHYERRPPWLMGGASPNHASPIISQNSNLLSDNATQLCPGHQHHHLSPPPITGTEM